jgi:hypothetical protein
VMASKEQYQALRQICDEYLNDPYHEGVPDLIARIREKFPEMSVENVRYEALNLLSGPNVTFRPAR